MLLCGSKCLQLWPSSQIMSSLHYIALITVLKCYVDRLNVHLRGPFTQWGVFVSRIKSQTFWNIRKSFNNDRFGFDVVCLLPFWFRRITNDDTEEIQDLSESSSLSVCLQVSVIVFQIWFALYTGSFLKVGEWLLGGDEYEREYCESLTPVCEFCLWILHQHCWLVLLSINVLHVNH